MSVESPFNAILACYVVFEFCLYVHVCSLGATPEASVTNLYNWLDAVALSVNLHQTFVFDGSNTRVVGCYHHTSKQQQEAAF